jgi:hypothetical protein
MKQVEYEFTADDFVQFNLHHNRHSPEIRRRFLVAWITIPVVMWTLFLLLPLVLRRDEQTYWQGIVAIGWYFVMPLFFLAYYPWAARRRVTGLIHGMLKEGANRSLLGPRSITIDASGITSKSAVSTNSQSWGAVNRVVRTEESGYIYTSSVSAVVIPRRAFDSQTAFDEFLNEAESLRQAAAG